MNELNSKSGRSVACCKITITTTREAVKAYKLLAAMDRETLSGWINQVCDLQVKKVLKKELPKRQPRGRPRRTTAVE